MRPGVRLRCLRWYTLNQSQPILDCVIRTKPTAGPLYFLTCKLLSNYHVTHVKSYNESGLLEDANRASLHRNAGIACPPG